MALKELKSRLEKERNPEKAKLLQGFFKTGSGQYGEGDVFLGITVPEQRKIAKKFKEISMEEIQELLNSEIHEKRLIGLLILMEKNKKANEKEKSDIFNFYLENASRNNINNWDLVDLSAPNIVGNYLIDKDKKILYGLAKSDNLWGKRIAIISTYSFIRQNNFLGTLQISEVLLNDKHDLIHKAVGWMLREVGKRDKKILEDFLKIHFKEMPRTMLRYAIEKFDEGERKKWMKGEIK